MSGFGLTNCQTCDREFETSITVDSYDIDGWTKSDRWPDEEECDFCQGEETCSEEGCTAQATVLDTGPAVVYCAAHWEECCKENGDTVEECEVCVLRLDEHLHAKPKKEVE